MGNGGAKIEFAGLDIIRKLRKMPSSDIEIALMHLIEEMGAGCCARDIASNWILEYHTTLL